jgi:hypothetical protein
MPDNASYYHVAYVAAIIIYLLYAVSLFVRRSRLRK